MHVACIHVLPMNWSGQLEWLLQCFTNIRVANPMCAHLSHKHYWDPESHNTYIRKHRALLEKS